MSRRHIKRIRAVLNEDTSLPCIELVETYLHFIVTSAQSDREEHGFPAGQQKRITVVGFTLVHIHVSDVLYFSSCGRDFADTVEVRTCKNNRAVRSPIGSQQSRDAGKSNWGSALKRDLL